MLYNFQLSIHLKIAIFIVYAAIKSTRTARKVRNRSFLTPRPADSDTAGLDEHSGDVPPQTKKEQESDGSMDLVPLFVLAVMLSGFCCLMPKCLLGVGEQKTFAVLI